MLLNFHIGVTVVWSGMESVEETCFLCHFYREGRFVTHTFTTTTTTPPPQKHLLVNFFASPQFVRFVAGTGPNTEIRPQLKLFCVRALKLTFTNDVSQKGDCLLVRRRVVRVRVRRRVVNIFASSCVLCVLLDMNKKEYIGTHW